MQMLNVSALITGFEAVGDHTEFIVQISCNGGLWLISRRFSDFDQLHTRLVRSFGDLIEARLPEKQWFGRFDPNFLVKRQSSLQEYLDGLMMVPGIIDDRSLQHFLELEKHLDLDAVNSIGGNGSSRSNNGFTGKSTVMSENDRLSAIVQNATQTFIDISEVPEPLEADQAVQRKNEIVTASQAMLDEKQFVDGFADAMRVFQLPQPPVVKYTADSVLARLEAGPADSSVVTLEQEQVLLQSTLNQVLADLHLEIAPPSTGILAVMDGAMALTNGNRLSASGPGDDNEYGSSNGANYSLPTSVG